MTEEEIQALDNPAPRAKKPTVMDGYYNIIYKMLADGIGYTEIYAYIRKMGYNGNAAFKYIRSMDKNNFPDRKAENPLGYKKVHTERHRDQTGDLLKDILTRNPQATRDKNIEENIGVLKEKYPCIAAVEEMFASYHAIIITFRRFE